MFFPFSHFFQKQLPNFKYAATQFSLVYNACSAFAYACVSMGKKDKDTVKESVMRRNTEVAEQMAKWQDSNF